MSQKQEAIEQFQSASVKEVFYAILRSLRDQSKKLKVHSSKYLRQLESFLFSVNGKKISEEEFRILLLGREEKDLPFGLLACCGSKSKVDGNLRKSSYYSVKLLVRIFEEHPQRKDFLSIYADLEEDEFKLMSLSTHILADNQNDMAAYKLVKFVRDKRAHVSLSTIIEGRRVQEKFENWYKDQRKVQIEEEIKQTTWNEPPSRLSVSEEDPIRDQRDEKRKKKKKLLEHIQLNQQDKSVEFFISTFSDPLSLEITETDSKGKSKHRESSQKRKQISNLMSLAVNTQGNIEFVRGKLQQKGIKLEDIITKLHIDSESFDPFVLIQSLHSDTPNAQFVKVISKLQQAFAESRTMNQSLMYFFFDDLFILSNGITKLHTEFVKREYIETQKRKEQGNVISGEDDLILGRLKLKNYTLSHQLNGIADNLNSMKKNQFQLRQCLVFLQKFEGLVKLPQEIKKAYVQKDYKQVYKQFHFKVVFLYQQNKQNIAKFRSLSIFQQLFQEINTNLLLSFEDILTEIKQETKDFQRLCDLCSAILDLPTELAVNYPGGKLKEPYEKMLAEHPQTQNKPIQPNAFLILSVIMSQLNTEAAQYLENEQETSQTATTLIDRVQGDMISEFLNDMGIVIKKTEKKKAGKKAVVLNCKAVEKYFQSRFLWQFTHFYSLCVKFQQGDFDYRMGIAKSSDDQMNIEQPYAAGNSLSWRTLVQFVFKELVENFLSGFSKFLKRLQENWFQDDNVGKESAQFYGRVKTDMQSMSSVLFHYEQILLATKYQSNDSTQQRILERTKRLKTEMQMLYMKILFEEFRNMTLNQVNLDETSIPQPDFFGLQISEYVLQIVESISKIFFQLGNFALHEGLYVTNKEIFCQYLNQLMQQALNKVKSKHLTMEFPATTPPQQQRLIRRTRCLVFLHNLRNLEPKSSCGVTSELVDGVYSDLTSHVGRASQFSTNMSTILNTLQINRRLSRRQSRLSISSLYGAPLTPIMFSEICSNNMEKLIESFYKPTLSLYLQELEPDFLQIDNKTLGLLPPPRPFLYDWLELINEQITQASLLLPVNMAITDSIINFVLGKFFGMIELQNKQESRRSSTTQSQSDQQDNKAASVPQLWSLCFEIQFFEQMTAKMHGDQSRMGFEKVYERIMLISGVKHLDELFPRELDIQSRQDLLRNSRYKVQYNFKGLFGYF